jgi:hypothetical protein
MKLLSLDPSGNWGKEGMGTTGFCIMEDGVVTKLGEIKAGDFSSEVEYWKEHRDLIEKEWPDALVVEGFKLYHHKGQESKSLAHSELQTSQLIGILKLTASCMGIPLTIQFASDVKTRWSEDVLVRIGILEKKGSRYYWNGEATSTHKRDSLKHALHWDRYKKGEK